MPTYNDKTYQAVARILAEVEHRGIRQRLTSAFAVLFASDNPRFDGRRFRDAVEQRPGQRKEVSDESNL